MTKSAVFLILLATGLAAPGFAQPVARLVQGSEPVVYEFKNLDATRARSVINLTGTIVNSVRIVFNDEFNLAVLHGNIRPELEKALELLRKYDVPQPPKPEVQFTAYLVQARTNAGPNQANGSPSAAPPPDAAQKPDAAQDRLRPIPAELQTVVAEMKRTFAYDSYNLLDVIRTEAAKFAEYEGTVPGSPVERPTFLTLSYGSVSASADRKTVSVIPFEFSVKFPFGPMALKPEYGISRIKTEISIHEGQKLVLGKVQLAPGSNADLFLILTAKVR